MSKRTLDSEHKPELLDYFCHEVRTSLNSIVLFSKLLKKNEDGKLEDDQQKYAHAIYRSSQSLLELTDRTLELSRIKSGVVEPAFETVNIQTLCNKLEQLFLPLANTKNLFLTFEQVKDGIESIHTDRLGLEQILKNLISNALKFTSEGGISVYIDLLHPSEAPEVSIDAEQIMVFHIQDTGIGIPPDKQQIIFKDFIQADPSIREKYEGSGLGLAICKKTAEMLGGDLKVNSNEGAGSTFSVYLPVSCSSITTHRYSIKSREENNDEVLPDDNDSADRDRKSNYPADVIESTILLVDDSPIHNSALKEFLSQKVSKCLTATSARDTYNILENNRIDYIVLDMILPDASGLDLLSFIKNDERHKDIYTIIYTGKNLSNKETNEIKVLADEVVYKSAGSYKTLMNIISSFSG